MLDTEKMITIRLAKVTRILGYIVALLVIADFAAQIVKLVEWHSYINSLIRYLSYEQMAKIISCIPKVYQIAHKFDMGLEGNVPTYFSAVIILIAAFLLNTIAAFKKRNGHSYVLHWRILAFIFVFLSIDEMVGIHELASSTTANIIRTSWLHYNYAWVIPGGIFVLIVALSYCRFLLHLPCKSKLLVSIAGVLFVGGAIGVEIFGWRYYMTSGPKDLIFHMIVTLEETLEMAGIILFIYTLLDYMRSNVKEMSLCVGSPD